MPFQIVPNAALATIRGTLLGEQVVNTLGFGLTTPGVVTAAELSALGAGLESYWADTMTTTLPQDYVYQDILLRVLDVENGPVAEESSQAGQVGALVGAVLPANVTFVVSFRTGLGGATNRGRNYVCGLLESEVTGNSLSVGRITALQAAYQGMVGAGTVANGWIWSVISRKPDPVTGYGRAVPITSAHITDARVDTQRRRLPR